MSLHRYDKCAPPIITCPPCVQSVYCNYTSMLKSQRVQYVSTRLRLLELPCATCSGVFYPGTGGADEVGYLQGQGYSVNVPWPHGGMGNGALIVARHVLLFHILSLDSCVKRA